jgi:tryptophan synthase alpha chain
VSKPEQVDTLRGLADGIIVGSAIVRHLERIANGSASASDVIREVGEFAASMVAATKK